MDTFDYKILAQVQTDSRMTAERISEGVGLSPAAVQKRLKRLRDSGVIRAEVALLDPRKLGHPMTVITEVSLERENLNVLDAFKRRMRQAEEVQQCYYTTGEADFIIILLVRDIQHYEKFTREYFFGNSEISKFKTNIVMDQVKVGLKIPIHG
ncbi:Lrp/AsnC family transcriptional regulator [Kiloniella antarctica]|uniref:Lrp/AsnC family transcriptional regulator n=1 Tax=Kiloniella antarctica TaxID=1550907 RepID=A0ABW5BHT3_9PROT